MLRSRWTYGLLALALLGVLAAHLSGTEDKWLITTTIPLHLAVLGAVIWLFRNGQRHRAKLVLASLSVVVALLLVEVLLHFAAPQRAVRNYRGLASNEYHHRLPSSVTMYHGLFEDQHVFVTTNEDGLRKIRSCQRGTLELCSVKKCTAEVCSAQVGSFECRSSEICLLKIRGRGASGSPVSFQASDRSVELDQLAMMANFGSKVLLVLERPEKARTVLDFMWGRRWDIRRIHLLSY